MKYFSKELWKDLNSEEPERRKLAEQRWQTADEEYAKYFDGIKKRLPHSFIKTFLAHSGFHDYLIQCLSFIPAGGRDNCCEFTLFSPPYTIQLVFQNVTKLQCNVDGLSSCVGGELSWGYTEMEILLDKIIEMRILFDPENEMLIDCKKIWCTVSTEENGVSCRNGVQFFKPKNALRFFKR